MLEKNRRMKALPRSIKGPLIKMLASGRGVRPSARWLRDTAGYMKDVQLQSVVRRRPFLTVSWTLPRAVTHSARMTPMLR
jgi:hypothetical protein